MNRAIRHLAIAIATALLVTVVGTASAQNFGPWSDPQPVTAIDVPTSAEGCPIESPDGLALYFASNRPGGQGKNDNWRTQRASVQSAWGAPENLAAPANSPEFDYCPTPLADHSLLFVSSRQTSDDCFPGDTPPPPPTGGPSAGDIFLTQESGGSFSTPMNLGCYPSGPNTPGAEFSPSMLTTSAGTFLFFSSNGYPDSVGQDIYMSQVEDDGTVLAGVRVEELSTAADDRMPNVRSDALEVVFSSNRGGNMDIYVATRANPGATWSAPQRIDSAAINTGGSETRSSLSEDGTRLYFGRKVDGSDPGDVYVSTRSRTRAAALSTPTLGAPMLALLAALLGAGGWLAQRSRRNRHTAQ